VEDGGGSPLYLSTFSPKGSHSSDGREDLLCHCCCRCVLLLLFDSKH